MPKFLLVAIASEKPRWIVPEADGEPLRMDLTRRSNKQRNKQQDEQSMIADFDRLSERECEKAI